MTLYEVHDEPIFDTPSGRRKPDLVAIKDNKGFIIDAQVVSHHSGLDASHLKKLNYYRPLQVDVLEKFNFDEVNVHSITLNWRGVWSQKSADLALADGILQKSDLAVVATRVLVGGLAAFNVFSRGTWRARGGH